MRSGIYQILHRDSGLSYVGHSHKIDSRWCQHRSLLRRGAHYAVRMQRTWAKYGEDSFDFVLLEECSQRDLVKREQHYLDNLKPAFNTSKSAKSRLGVPQSPETVELIRQASIGRPKSDETRARLSAALVGRKLSPEHCAKLRAAKQNISPETRAKMSAAGRRKAKPSQETRDRMSAALKGRVFSPEHREKIRLSQIGKTFSAETRAKMSAANNAKGRKHSEETKRKIRESCLARFALKTGGQ